MQLWCKIYNILVLLCGLVSALVGIIVMVGWHTHDFALIQIRPDFAPMQYNTALGFALAGLGLCSLVINYRHLAKLLGSCVIILGGGTLFQYLSGVNLGLDELFMDAYVTVKTTHPGRMAPNTALCFTLMGLAILIGGQVRKIKISIAASIIVLSILSIVGYMANVQGLYGWGNLTRMAIHTAVCFLILGIGLLCLTHQERNRESHGTWYLLPLVLSSVVLILSLLSSLAIRESTQVRNTEHFERLVNETNDALVRRYSLYQHSLLGGAGMFYASESVERHEWKMYVEALDIETNLPGIAGIGYIASVQAENLSSYVQSVREDGAPQFKNHPKTQNTDKFIITFIEPEEFNAKAIGLDIGFEGNRRHAAEYARDSGKPALTKKIILVQDGQQTPGFLLLVPIYDTGSLPSTLKERQNHLSGWVYAPFIAMDFMKGLTSINQDQVSFEVYDGEHTTAENLIYRSTSDKVPTNSYAGQTTLDLAGRKWTINWSSTDKFVPIGNKSLSLILLIFGVLCSLLLYFTLLHLLRSKDIIAQEVEKQTQKLVNSEKRLQLVFDSAGEGIYGLDRNGHTMFANKAAEELLGYKLDEMAEAFLPDLIANVGVGEAPYRDRDKSFISAISDGKTQSIDTELFSHKNGSKISVEYTSRPSIDEDGEINGAVVVFRDIADRKAAEAEIKEANAELEEFAYRTSHDLRSPLVSSITLLNMAKEAIHEEDKGKALASLGHTQNSLRKLEELVKDILVLTQAKNEEERIQAINIEAVIKEGLDKLKHMDNFDRLDIQYDLKFSKPFLSMKNRIVLIVENLISNAIKYQDLTKEDSYLRISTYQSENNFVLTLRDNGIGVPKDQQGNLFQMFKRFHPRTSFGSGLGLYMMKKSVNILGGEIYFEDPGEGSLFKIAIPLSQSLMRQND